MSTRITDAMVARRTKIHRQPRPVMSRLPMVGARSGEVPIIHWDGEQTRDYVNVEDVARANLAAQQFLKFQAGAFPVFFHLAIPLVLFLRLWCNLTQANTPRAWSSTKCAKLQNALSPSKISPSRSIGCRLITERMSC